MNWIELNWQEIKKFRGLHDNIVIDLHVCLAGCLVDPDNDLSAIHVGTGAHFIWW